MPLIRPLLPALLPLATLAALVAGAHPASAQCATTVFHEDFETGAPGWTLSGNWVLRTETACQPACVVGTKATLRTPSFPAQCGCRAYNNTPQYTPCSGDLVSPPIALPRLAPGESLTLDFCLGQTLDTIVGGCPVGPEICQRLEVSSPTQSVTWSLGGVLCPLPTQLPPYDLTPFRGEVVRLRWTPACVDEEGTSDLIVDDVSIVRTTGPPATYCRTAPNSAGPGAQIAHQGSTSVAQDDFHLAVAGAPPAQLGIFYFGDGSLQAPFGQGWRCVGGSVERLVPPLQVAPDGTAGQQLLLGQPPAQGKLVAGSTWHFQFWYRDPAGGGAGFNLSDALRATFCP